MKFSLSLVLSILLSSVTAIPTPDEAASTIVQVVPGPGLPSLESLGITSADLFNKDFKPIAHSPTPANRLFKRQSSCQTDYQASRVNAIACRNYLIQTGTYTCSSGDTYATLCTAGDAEIVGWNYDNIAGGVQTSCSDAAVAASWVIDNCSACQQDSCGVEGQDYGTANPNFFVYIDKPVGQR